MKHKTGRWLVEESSRGKWRCAGRGGKVMVSRGKGKMLGEETGKQGQSRDNEVWLPQGQSHSLAGTLQKVTYGYFLALELESNIQLPR